MADEEVSIDDWAGNLVFGEEPREDVTEEVIDEAEPVEEVEASEEVEDTEEVEAKEADEPEFVEVEYDGTVYEVPPKLKDALMMQGDYTRKTQEVSAQRKAVEAEQALLKSERERYTFLESVQDDVAQMQQVEAAIPQWKQYLRENIDNLSATEIEKIRLQVDELETQKRAVQEGLKAKYDEFQQAQQQSQAELLEKSTEVLKGKFPDFNLEAVEGYAKSLGFSDDQVALAKLDPKQMELVRKAMLYDRLQEGKGNAVAKLKGAPQIKQKSRNPMPKDVQDKLNLRKKLKSQNLSKSDKANLVGEDIAKRFGM